MKKILLGLLICAFSNLAVADDGEGMWLPLLLKSLNEAEMQSMGMKMSAEDIYSVNKGSLKDAIVHFGGFCTSELISDQGLLLTNHHCGYGQIQSHSAVGKNYLKDGFWAENMSTELPNAGLTATFIVRIEDVTKAVFEGVTEKMTLKERQSAIDKNLATVEKNVKLESHEDVAIKPFYKGNQYFLFVSTTYKDVRLVGAPPESIGKFGSDTDNWVWPRHTGDFALFRIYAGQDNLPADYSEDNVPYKPKHFLPVSVDGVEADDFTLVFGFPGRTDQYLPKVAVQQTVDVLNPVKIGIRDKALKIVDAAMRKDEATKIKYASKFARIANYWKKWIGESQGIKATDGIGRKIKFEEEFTKAIGKNKKAKKAYGNILPEFEKLYKAIEPYAQSRDYYNEVMGRNIELFRTVSLMKRLVGQYEKNGAQGYIGFKGRLSDYLKDFYKNYDPEIDQQVCSALLDMYVKNAALKEAVTGTDLTTMGKKNYPEFVKSLYGKTAFTTQKGLDKIFEMKPEAAVAKIKEDPGYKLYMQLNDKYSEYVSKPYNEYKEQIDAVQRNYMKALIEVFPEKRFYPDANSTMRVTYGQVKGYQPRDAVTYTPSTYLSGVIEKYKPGDYEFDVPEKLIELYKAKDYGAYGENGKMPVCFIGSNHTTGGNSGSPAIDAHGNLIGLNFDRAWEGTMSDINYDPSICRNIMVDIRYVLFIVDKFAGAKWIVDEMKLVHPKRK